MTGAINGRLTMAQAAREFGIGTDRAAARRLTYLLRKRESETGAKIIDGGGARGARAYVTLASLRKHYAELVGDDYYLSAITRELQHWVKDELAAHRAYQRALAKRLTLLETAVAQIPMGTKCDNNRVKG